MRLWHLALWRSTVHDLRGRAMRETTVLLECNICRARRQGRVGESVAELRDKLADVGWYSDAANDVDVCPNHIPEDVFR